MSADSDGVEPGNESGEDESAASSGVPSKDRPKLGLKRRPLVKKASSGTTGGAATPSDDAASTEPEAAPAPAATKAAAPAPATPATPTAPAALAAAAPAAAAAGGGAADKAKAVVGGLVEKYGKTPMAAAAAFVGFVVLGGLYFAFSSTGDAGKAVMNSGGAPQSGASALGGAPPPCKDVKDQRVTPLVVDWTSDERTELEIAMKDGLAVVEYTCNGLRVLPDCRVEGTYRFSGVQPKEEVRQLASADDFSANLPKSATGKLGASLSTELSRGSALDIATITVGRIRTIRDEIFTGDLKGKCGGATHLVRGANVGAFAKDVGQKGKLKAAGELFGSGSTTASSASAMSRSTDGSVTACKKATADDAKPPPQCGSAVVLELIPITAKSTGKYASSEAVGACPVGMVYANSKCVKKDEATSFQCDAGDFKVCSEQCAKNNAGSCHLLGQIQYYTTTIDGKANANYNIVESEKSFKKACDAGHKGGCSYVAYIQLMASKIDAATAQKIMEAGAAEGDNSSRTNLGWLLAGLTSTNNARQPLKFTKDFDRGISLMAKACDAGDPEGCWGLGAALAGKEDSKLPPEQIAYAAKANTYYCQRDIKNCYYAGELSLFGTTDVDFDKATPLDKGTRLITAIPSFVRSCANNSNGSAASCAELKELKPICNAVKIELDTECKKANDAAVCGAASKLADAIKTIK